MANEVFYNVEDQTPESAVLGSELELYTDFLVGAQQRGLNFTYKLKIEPSHAFWFRANTAWALIV
jgi:hypothetical protein